MRTDDPHDRHDERDGGDHDDDAPPANHQQQQGKSEVQLGLHGHRPERCVGAPRGDDVLHEQAVDEDRFRVGYAVPRLGDDQPRHREAEGERRPVRREDAPRPPRANRDTASSRQPWRAGDRANEKPDSTMNTTTAKRP